MIEKDIDGEDILAGMPATSSGLDQNRDDKLTQSQMLKRMLEADERDNQMDRVREDQAEDREQ